MRFKDVKVAGRALWAALRTPLVRDRWGAPSSNARFIFYASFVCLVLSSGIAYLVIVFDLDTRTKQVADAGLVKFEAIRAARWNHVKTINACKKKSLDIRTCHLLWEDSHPEYKHWTENDKPNSYTLRTQDDGEQ